MACVLWLYWSHVAQGQGFMAHRHSPTVLELKCLCQKPRKYWLADWSFPVFFLSCFCEELSGWMFLCLVLIQVWLTSAPRNVGIWGHEGPVVYLRYRVACICFLVELWTSPNNFSYGIDPMLINHLPNQIETIIHFQTLGSDLSPTRQAAAVEPIYMPSPSDNPCGYVWPLSSSLRGSGFLVAVSKPAQIWA